MNIKNVCQCNTNVTGQIQEFTNNEYAAKPAKHKILLCLGTSCHVRGSTQLLERLSCELGIEPGQVTADGMFFLEVVRCLGACAVGPVIMIDEVLYPNMEPDKITKILERYKK